MKNYLFFAFMAIFQMISAQNYTLSGRLIDDTNEAVPYAIVTLLSADENSVIEQTSTDLEGNFLVKSPKKSVKLVIYATGFIPYEGNSFVLDKNTTLLPIILQVSVTELSGVVVSTSRKSPTIQLKEGKIIFSPTQNATTSSGNAFDILKKTPTILIDNTHNISILGKKGAVVFINGKSTYMQSEDLSNYLKSIPSSQIKTIEVMTNPPAEYDAEGSAGIINIVLTGKGLAGTFLSVGSGVSYWKHLRNHTDISLQHTTEKLTINAGYSHQVGNLGIYYGSTRFQDDKKIISISDDTDRRKFISGNFGIDYQFNTKNSLGLKLTTNTAFGKGEIDTQNDIYTTDNQLEKTLFAVSDYFSQKANRYGATLFYKYQPTENQQYNFDIDYVFFDGGTKNWQPNSHQFPNQPRLADDTFLTENLRKIHIFAMTLQQKMALGKGNWASGIKFSQVASDNTFRLFSVAIPQNILDANRSNLFDYRERILAIYAQYSYPFSEKWSAEAGFRTEYTFPLGKLTPFAGSSQKYQENGTNYADFFPSLSVNYQQNEKISYGMSYGSRISRPAYQDLNPFSYPLDGLSAWKGNPFLSPQKIHKISANASWNTTNLVISYTLTNDFSAQITEKWEANKVLMIPKNVGKQEYLSASVFQEILVGNWYKIRLNPTIFYIKNAISLVEYPNFALKRLSFSVNSQHEFSLPFQIKGNISTDYYSRRINAANEIAQTTGFVDVGLQRSFWQDKLAVSLAFTDIFHTNRWDNESHFPNLASYNWGNFESRQLKFHITYKIGKPKNTTQPSELNEVERL